MRHLESAFKGSNKWYKYLLMFVITIVGGNIVGALPLVLATVISSVKAGSSFEFDTSNLNPTLTMALMLVPFAVGLFLFIKFVEPIHNRTAKEVINGTNKIRWSRFFYAATVWGLFSAVLVIADYWLSPESYTVRFDWGALIPLTLVSVLIIPLQSSFEEVLFRGYLAQGVGVLFKNRILTILIPAVLFALMHGVNPEVDAYGFWYAMTMYLTFGLMFGITSVLDDGIEVAMGAHAANNVFLSIFVTSKVSALQTPALLMDNTTDFTALELIGFIVISAIFIVVLGLKYKWSIKTFTQPVEVKNADSLAL